MPIDPNSIVWDDAPAAPAAPVAGPVYGPKAKAPSMAEMARLDLSRQSEDRQAHAQEQANSLAERKFAYDQAQDAAKNEKGGGDGAARIKLMQVIGKLGQVAKDANDDGGWFETGTSGKVGRAIPFFQTAGKDLAANMETLNANFAFDALQAMRDASKTGGALGSVSEMELSLLKSAVANLDPSQSHEQFLANVESARQAYLAKLAMVDPQIATRMGYDSQKAEAALLQLNDSYNQEFGLTEQPTIDRSEAAPVASGNPEDIDAILAKYGVQ